MSRWILLLVLSLAFGAGFVWQRQRSVVLAVEAKAERAESIAASTGLRPAEVMAAVALFAPKDAGWLSLATELAGLRDELGHLELAALALAGARPLAEQLRQAAGGDPTRVPELVQRERAAVEIAGRYRALVERFERRRADP